MLQAEVVHLEQCLAWCHVLQLREEVATKRSTIEQEGPRELQKVRAQPHSSQHACQEFVGWCAIRCQANLYVMSHAAAGPTWLGMWIKNMLAASTSFLSSFLWV